MCLVQGADRDGWVMTIENIPHGYKVKPCEIHVSVYLNMVQRSYRHRMAFLEFVICSIASTIVDFEGVELNIDWSYQHTHSDIFPSSIMLAVETNVDLFAICRMLIPYTNYFS